ncbi:hypothetical protein FG379_001049 [Cryptosporidium bovis]|uniref:uncharacterized protein n=1 Tax=Cryptosporidium bovis TaxID=310047 RepID=UPI00351A2C78|nr:hypothetical protein FG379_001049 [Cryptosporidium bovis]
MRLNRAFSPLFFAFIVLLDIHNFTLFANSAASPGDGRGGDNGKEKKKFPWLKLAGGFGGLNLFSPKGFSKGTQHKPVKGPLQDVDLGARETDAESSQEIKSPLGTPDFTPPDPVADDVHMHKYPEPDDKPTETGTEDSKPGTGDLEPGTGDLEPEKKPSVDLPEKLESSDDKTGMEKGYEAVVPPIIPGGDFRPLTTGDVDPVFRNLFSNNWLEVFSPESVYYPLLKLDLDKSSLIGSSKILETILSRYNTFIDSQIGSLNIQLGISKDCADLSDSEIYYLEAFSHFLNNLIGTRMPNDEICLIFSKSKTRGSDFVSDIAAYLGNNKNISLGMDVLKSINLSSLNYKAGKSFRSSDLTVYGIKRLAKENYELAAMSNCQDDQIIFSMALSLISDIYKLDLSSVSRIEVGSICEILKTRKGFNNLIFELTLNSHFRRGIQNFDNLPFDTFIIKNNLERSYRQLSEQFLSYFMEYDLDAIKVLSRTMDSEFDVKDVIGDVESIHGDGAIKTSDRYIQAGFPIPEIPGPPSRKVLTKIPTPISDSELFLPSRTTKTLYFGYGESYPTRPEVLPEKQAGREFVKEFVTHISPRDYETQFTYGSSQFTGPKLSYYKRLSEREFIHKKKINQLKEEQKRLESRRKRRMTSGYRDLSELKEGSVSFDETSEPSEISEEPSPIPVEAPKEEIPSRFDEKLHNLVPKTKSSVYKQPRKYGPLQHELDYTTLKPVKRFDSVGYPFRRGGSYRHYDHDTSTRTDSSESSDGTIGISEEASIHGRSQADESDIEGITRAMESLSIHDKLPKKSAAVALTTEIAAREIPLKCRELIRPQQKRALGLFRVLKYLYNGSTEKWYITAFCRAVYFAERDVCIERGVKDLDIKKMASECYTSLRSAPFVLSNPALSRLARQVCYTFYKRRGASVCN